MFCKRLHNFSITNLFSESETEPHPHLSLSLITNFSITNISFGIGEETQILLFTWMSYIHTSFLLEFIPSYIYKIYRLISTAYRVNCFGFFNFISPFYYLVFALNFFVHYAYMCRLQSYMHAAHPDKSLQFASANRRDMRRKLSPVLSVPWLCFDLKNRSYSLEVLADK